MFVITLLLSQKPISTSSNTHTHTHTHTHTNTQFSHVLRIPSSPPQLTSNFKESNLGISWNIWLSLHCPLLQLYPSRYCTSIKMSVCFPYLQPDTHTKSIPAQYGAMSALITNMCTLVCCLCFYICVRWWSWAVCASHWKWGCHWAGVCSGLVPITTFTSPLEAALMLKLHINLNGVCFSMSMIQSYWTCMKMFILKVFTFNVVFTKQIK